MEAQIFSLKRKLPLDGRKKSIHIVRHLHPDLETAGNPDNPPSSARCRFYQCREYIGENENYSASRVSMFARGSGLEEEGGVASVACANDAADSDKWPPVLPPSRPLSAPCFARRTCRIEMCIGERKGCNKEAGCRTSF